ncbi:MAG: ThuA domain-containing protein [Pirellulales bacterium]
MPSALRPFAAALLALACVALLSSPCLMAADTSTGKADKEKPLQILFLGDKGHHKPEARWKQLQTALAPRGVTIVYSENANDLNDTTLAGYDGLILYANTDKIEPAQEAALLNYVENGKGFIPLHCASFCFQNSEKFIALVGGQFKSHGGEIFDVKTVAPTHPIMQGYGGFSSWDETYVHTKHNEKDRTVLEVREQGGQAKGQKSEPWTWVRTQGKGRVFYTAWGHDERTFGNPGYANLVERGIRWACGRDVSVVPAYAEKKPFDVPKMTAHRTDVKPFEYDDVGPKIPIYEKSDKWGVKGEPATKMQRPLSPEESLKHYQTPEGFELRLFASEKDFLNKPIAMNWDERGRLWLCETLDYPNELQQPGQGRDRIRVCEDTNGDGVADAFTVFAEGLSIPTAILPIRGGCLVQNATETLFLKDTDGDGKADLKKVLVTGWAAGDTHGGVSNFQYGPDNWVWAMQGYNSSKPVLANGEAQGAFRQGFFRMKLNHANPPEIEKIEFLRSTDNNTWGLGFSEEGYVFGSTANRNPSVYLPIPNRYYEAVRGWTPELLAPRMAPNHYFAKPGTDKIRQVDQFDGYTAGAGHAVYTARNYPQQYWNRLAFVCEPTAHIVGAFVIDADGAGFKSHTPFNIVQSDDEWAAPIMAEVGPDGNLWILDWYNFIVQHNPTPAGFKTGKGNAYESDLRDKRHGRIYRLLYTGDEKAVNGKPRETTALTTHDLSKATTAQLVEGLKSDNRFWRLQAQRLLVEKADPASIEPLSKLAMDRTANEYAVVHALQTLEGLDGAAGTRVAWKDQREVIDAAAKNPSPAVRVAVARMHPRYAEFADTLETMEDAEPQVKLAKYLGLFGYGNAPISGILRRELRDPVVMQDRQLRDALTCLATRSPIDFAQMGNSHDDKLNPAIVQIASIVAEHFAREKPNHHATFSMFETVALSKGAFLDAMIAGFARGWPKGYQLSLSEDDEGVLNTYADALNGQAQANFIALARAIGSREMDKRIAALAEGWRKTLADAKAKSEDRIRAANDLATQSPDDAKTVEALLAPLTNLAPPDLVAGLLDALAKSTAPNLGKELLVKLPQLSPAGKDGVMRLLLKRPATTGELLDALDKGELQASDLKLDQQTALRAHPDRRIAARAQKILAKSGGIPDADREKVIVSYHAASDHKGDAAKGKLLFTANCAKCHRHSGEGNTIGPDLTGMNVHPKHELLTQILDPSRSVESNFRQYTVETTDGRVLTGLLAAESRTAIELIDAEAKKIALPRDEIDTLTAGKKSLMPEGFEKTLSVEQMTDLLEFLAQRGKYVPLPLAKAATVVSTDGMFYDKANKTESLNFRDWSPRTFQGVPFLLVDPRDGKQNNVVLLNGPQGAIPPTMPKSVTVPCAGPAKALHILGGVAGWASPGGRKGSVSMIVRLHYADGKTEDHEWKNGEEIADYIRRVDVPNSTFAFDVGGRQVRYVKVEPKRAESIKEIELVKGRDDTAPIVVAVTAESP